VFSPAFRLLKTDRSKSGNAIEVLFDDIVDIATFFSYLYYIFKSENAYDPKIVVPLFLV